MDHKEAATRVPVQGESNELSKIRQNDASDFAYTGALALVEDVIAVHADRIGTHYEDCYKYHVACLAVAVKHRLGGEGHGD